MDKESLQLLLAQGLSVERIAKRFGKDPSTISYWMKKHGLESRFVEKHAPRGPLQRDELEQLIATGASIRSIAEAVDRSAVTVRHWLTKYGLETSRTVARRAAVDARNAGQLVLQRECRHHGLTTFWLEGRGTYRCMQCRTQAVVRRRRKVKEILVGEAGGACMLCGYSEWPGALEFHHRDPTNKAFSVSATGVTRSLERARAEARKCVLLCSNCQAEVEGGYKSLPPSPQA
jgi:transposase